ncbi:hypothetical protein Acr_03g0003120 [Actinidia rufa]|uniref:Probable zinc-ribbon domain-containing protein n=1 Tax=Actinidia rufa TaxID=165716 RepID=A0A7J0EAQ6_9ERIC|nr:hypothetical protein Acr_03g0003120 [Actinidia rufa]
MQNSSPRTATGKEQWEGQNEVSSPAAILETEVDQDVCSDEVASSTALHHLEIESSSPATGDHSEGDENGKCLEQDDGRNKNEYAYCKGKQPRNVVKMGSVWNKTIAVMESSLEVRTLPRKLLHQMSLIILRLTCHHRWLELKVKEMKMENAWNKTIAMGGSLEVKTLPRKLLHQRSFIFFEIEEPSPVAGAHSEIHEIRNCSEEDNERFQNEHGYLDGKQYGGENFTEKVASSNKLNDLGIEESPLVARAHSEVDEIRNCLEQDNASNRISSPPVAGAPSEIHESRTCSEEDNQRYQHEHGSCNENQSVGENFTKEDPSSIETNHLKSKDSSPVAGAHSNSRCENLTDKVASSTALNHLESEESPPVAGAHSEVHDVTTYEVPSSTELTGPEIEESFPEVDENIKSSIFGSSRVENLLAARPKDSIITAQGPLGESILTETCTSLHSDQLEQPQKRSLAGFDRVNSIDTSGTIILANSGSEFSITLRDMHKFATTRSNHAYDGSVSSYNGTDDQVPDQYRHLWKRKWKAAESSSKWHQDEFLGPTSHGHTARSRMRFESGECRSRVPFYSRVGYEKGGPSNYEREPFRSSTKPKNPGEGNLELLKMVFELQDQINRTRMSKGNGNGRFPGTDKHIPSYYDHWHSSAPLPPYIFYNESQYTAHPCQRHYNLHRYSPSSPQHHTSSEFSSQSCGENSGDRWHKDREVKKYPRERNYLKKHVRPLAIGAPFLVCYHCSEYVLKLPEDFLLFRRKCQKLKCSSEGKPFSIALLIRALKRDSNGKKMSSGSSFEPVEEREKSGGLSSKMLKTYTRIQWKPMYQLVFHRRCRKQVKLPSEIEELPSPLHMLKGYTSPTEVMHK